MLQCCTAAVTDARLRHCNKVLRLCCCNQVLRLENVVTVEELKDNEEYEELMEDMKLEAEKHGTVVKVHSLHAACVCC